MNHWGDEHRRAELQRFGPSFRYEPAHVHFRPHRWNWGSALVGFMCAASLICGAQWFATGSREWGLAAVAALVAMPGVWLIAGVE